MTEFSVSTLLPLLPELFLAIAALLLLVVGVVTGDHSAKPLTFAAIAAFVITCGLLLNSGGDNTLVLGGFFVHDRFAEVLKLLVLLGMAFVALLSLKYNEREDMGRFEFPILMLFITLGMLAMISAHNLLSLYVGLELQSLSIYVLAAFRRDQGRSSEAGLKYFILGALSSGMLLFGISYIYGATGAIDYDTLATAIKTVSTGNTGLTVGLVFVLVGIAFKISAVPFHMWTPDVYEGAPTSVTALMAIAPKIAALALMTRLLCGPFITLLPQWQQVVWFLSAASMTWGSFAAIGQKNIKRLMAYSSIGNMGYALIGLAAGTADGISALVLYLAIYMAMTAGAFGLIVSMRRNGEITEEIDALAGLSRTHPLKAYAMALIMFSMSGIPPLAGFFGKLVVFQAAIAAHLVVLAVLGVVVSVVAAYYYLRIIKIMFFDPNEAELDHGSGWACKGVMAVSVAFLLLFILSPNALTAATKAAAAVFFPG